MFNIGMENKPYEYTIKHDGIRAPYVTIIWSEVPSACLEDITQGAQCKVNEYVYWHDSPNNLGWEMANCI